MSLSNPVATVGMAEGRMVVPKVRFELTRDITPNGF